MNERIKELLKQSGWVYYEAQEGDIEKFAKLIVQECAEVASDYDGAHYVGTAIEKHFELK